MNFVIKKSVIEEAVKNLCRVINTKNTLPILGDILCKVNEADKTLEMIASDSEIWLTYTLILDEVAGDGSFCVEATRLMDALDQLSEQPLEITVTQGTTDMFTVHHSTGETFFPIANADEYPMPVDMTSEQIVSMPAREMASGLTSCLMATANDDLRPIMNGVHFNFGEKVTDIVASNGHVLMRYQIGEGYKATGAFTVPKKVAKMLPQMLDWSEDDYADISWNATQGCVEQEGWSLTFRFIDGTYPKYETVIPTDSPYWCKAYRNVLAQSIKKVSPFTAEASNMISCRFENAELTIKADDFDFATGANDKMSIESNIEQPMAIGLKASAIAAILSKMPYEKVTIGITDPSRAVTFIETPQEGKTSKTFGSILGLAMPMLLND